MTLTVNTSWIREWIEYARSDYDVAHNCLKDKTINPRQAAMHIQQAVEKAIKAALIAEGIEPPHIYDFARLFGESILLKERDIAEEIDLRLIST